jgi:hypothetical protein
MIPITSKIRSATVVRIPIEHKKRDPVFIAGRGTHRGNHAAFVCPEGRGDAVHTHQLSWFSNIFMLAQVTQNERLCILEIMETPRETCANSIRI